MFLVLFSLLVFSTLLVYPHSSLVSTIAIPLGDTEIPLLGAQFQGWMFRCEIVTCWGRFLLMGRFLFMALCLTLLLLAKLLNSSSSLFSSIALLIGDTEIPLLGDQFLRLVFQCASCFAFGSLIAGCLLRYILL